ncbi:MAG: ATP-binding protein, partial [Aggregatilineales bacterium]
MVANEEISGADKIAYLEKRVRVLTRLAEISASLNSQIGLKPLLHRIMEAAVDMLECEAASVLLWNSDTHQLFFAASTNDDGSAHLIGSPVPMNSLAGEILQADDIVQVDDVKLHPSHYNKVDEEIGFDTRSVLGIRMTYRKRVIGVLEVLNKRQLPWTDDDRQYLTILAAQAAVALEGAQLVMELRRANKELSQLDQLKDHFIAIASHELRTPLGVIMGYAAFLQEDESETARENAGHVLSSALKLRSIIEDMVNLNYLKQKEGDLQKKYVKVADLFATFERDTIALMDVLNREVTIRPPDDSVMVYVDAGRMHMALTNIFNNAVSFTDEDGKIVIHAAIDRENVHISVKDDGVGMDAEHLDLIFKEFYQVENHLVRRHEGLGIGLSITRAIVQAHRGRLGA